jgi:hypothetical protein
MLPTTQSDLPVATFLTVVLRPAVHVLYTVIGAIVVCVMSYKVMQEMDSVAKGLEMLIGGFICLYFANLIIGAVFDFISLPIVIANSLKNIERK